MSKAVRQLHLAAVVDPVCHHEQAQVAYEDRSLATYDRKDDIWIGAGWETTEVKDNINLEIFLDLEIPNGKIVNSELLRKDYSAYR